MVYFYKKSESGKAIVCTNVLFDPEKMTKTVKFKNGKSAKLRVQLADLKFGVFGTNGNDVGEFKLGEEVPVKFTDIKVVDQNGAELNLYWLTPE